MKHSQQVRAQLKDLTSSELCSALVRDDWVRDEVTGAVQVYYKCGKRVTVHRHPHKTYGPGLLAALIDDIGWTEADLRRLKLIK